MSFSIIHGDIVTMDCDAIVNAANSALQMGGGVCGSIFRAAGMERLQQACDSIGGCACGQAVITEGFDLPARYVIHTVGPVWQGGTRQEAAMLASCYRQSVLLAREKHLHSVAFPLISTGIFGYPYKQALEIAEQVLAYQNDMDLFLVLYP